MRRLFVLLLIIVCSVALPARAESGLEFVPPVEGAVLRGFEPGETKYSAGHRGVDLLAPVGTPVRAAAEGRVHFAGRVAGRPSVSVDHGNGLRTTYTPVQPAVSRGDPVGAGDVLGTVVGGHCDGGCLHWGLTDGDDYFDPLPFLSSRRIRLVPMGSDPVVRPAFSPATASAPGRAPVQGRLSSPFGMRRHPVTGIYKLHDGTDYAAPCSTPVHSPWAGVVIRTDVSRGYGYRVHIRHDDGRVTAYAHLPRFDVEVGDRVSAGQRIGVVGNTGYSTGCHLHWMAWVDGGLVDPLTLLG